MLKDEAQIKDLQLVDGSAIMLMGSAEGQGMQIENIQSKKFFEDMTPEEIARHHKETLGVVFV